MPASTLPRNVAKLATVKPAFAAKVKLVLDDMEALGWQPVIAEAKRNAAQQAAKVAGGFSKTNHSCHLYGIAVDICDARYAWNGPAANKKFKFWTDLGAVAHKHGLFWGGVWKMQDVAHVATKSSCGPGDA